MTRLSLLCFFTIISLLDSVTSTDNLIENTSEKSEFRKTPSKDCSSSYTTTCLKLDIVSWVDKLNAQKDFRILPGVSLVPEGPNAACPNTADIVAEVAREFPNDPDARLDAFLMKKVTGYLNSHSVKLNLFDAANSEVTARGKGGDKKGGGLEYLIAAGAMMKSTMFAMGMAALAALAGKALMTGLISLMLSAIIGVKSLASGGDKKTVYEVIAKPIYVHSNTHSISHEDQGGHYRRSMYRRSFDAPLPVGLQPGYKPAQV